MDEILETVAKQGLKPIDSARLHRVEKFADPEAGEITMMVPVTPTNVRDPDRKMQFFSSLIVTIRGQPITVNFQLDADTLIGAIAKWPDAAADAAKKFVEQFEDQQRARNLIMPASAQLQTRKMN